MKQTIRMLGRPIELELSKAAVKHLDNISAPLCVEMELYFSCLLRKQVRIRETIDTDFSVTVSDNLKISFRPVMTKSCSIESCDGDAPPLSDFPITKPECYVPHWLKIDVKKRNWIGEFGYFNEAVKVFAESELVKSEPANPGIVKTEQVAAM